VGSSIFLTRDSAGYCGGCWGRNQQYGLPKAVDYDGKSSKCYHSLQFAVSVSEDLFRLQTKSVLIAGRDSSDNNVFFSTSYSISVSL